ncbi:hypothetical protein [Brevundimonas sp.]|uniref:hypothetical protein n=1 Tax=Brevundimonas sp. TaxID=1871086 RepID=UPI0028AE8765|nr:hypothetical protein [Brevundimonas sp.]
MSTTGGEPEFGYGWLAVYHLQNSARFVMSGREFLSWVFAVLFGIGGITRLLTGPSERLGWTIATVMVVAAVASVWTARRFAKDR